MTDLGDPLFISAADQRYARSLWQMLKSVERLPEFSRVGWRIYDLGMAAKTRARLAARFDWAEFHSVDFSALPPHVGTNLKHYAWKAVVIEDAARTASGMLFWFDSATLFRRFPDDAVKHVIQDGLWYLRGQTPLRGRADPRSLIAMDAPADMLDQAEICSGALGFDCADANIRALLADWRAASLQPQIIAPQPDCAPFHRYDQTVLGVLILKEVALGLRSLQTDCIDISAPYPIRFITTRNKVPPWMPRAADLFIRSY